MKNTITINKKKKSSFRRKGKNLRKKTIKRYHKKSFAKGKKNKKTNKKTHKQKNGGTLANNNKIETMFGKANEFANKYVEENIEKNKKGGAHVGGLSIGNMWAKKTPHTKQKEQEYLDKNKQNSEIDSEIDSEKDKNEPITVKNPNLKNFIEYVIGIASFTPNKELTDDYKDTNNLESKWNNLDNSFKKFFMERKLNVDVIKSWKHMLRSGEKSNLEKLQRAYNDLKTIFTGTTFDSHKGENNIKKLEELMNEFKSDEDSDTVIADIMKTIEIEFIHSDQNESSESSEPSRMSKFKNFMSRKTNKSDPIEPDMSDHDSTTDEKIMINKEKDKYVWIRVNIPKDKSVMVQSDTSGTLEETLKNIKEEPSDEKEAE
jgi:hypothetical protein